MTERLPDGAVLTAFAAELVQQLRVEGLLFERPEPRERATLAEIRDLTAERSIVSSRLGGAVGAQLDDRDFTDPLCAHVMRVADKAPGEPYTRAELADLAVRGPGAEAWSAEATAHRLLVQLEQLYLGYPTLVGRSLVLAVDRVRRLAKVRRALYAFAAVEAASRVAALAPETLDPVALRAGLLAAVAELGPADST